MSLRTAKNRSAQIVNKTGHFAPLPMVACPLQKLRLQIKHAPMPPCARQSPSGIWQFSAGDSGSKQPFWMKKPVNVWEWLALAQCHQWANRCLRIRTFEGLQYQLVN